MVRYTKISSSPDAKSTSPLLVVVIIVLVLAAVGVLGMYFVHHRHHQTPVSAGVNTKGEPTVSSGTGKQDNTTAPPSTTGSQTGTSTNANLATPTGDFVSNHHPNLSGSPAPNTMTSVCTTTSGATCTISFTKDGVTKSLAPETTDEGGSAYWNWKLQDIGLTAGTWKITATAKQGGNTKIASDALNLEVSP